MKLDSVNLWMAEIERELHRTMVQTRHMSTFKKGMR